MKNYATVDVKNTWTLLISSLWIINFFFQTSPFPITFLFLIILLSSLTIPKAKPWRLYADKTFWLPVLHRYCQTSQCWFLHTVLSFVFIRWIAWIFFSLPCFPMDWWKFLPLHHDIASIHRGTVMFNHSCGIFRPTKERSRDDILESKNDGYLFIALPERSQSAC